MTIPRTLTLLCLSCITSLLIISCSSSKPAQKKTYSQTYYNLTFSPESVTKKIINNTEITVVPIDAKSLNKEMFDAANRDGNYDKEVSNMLEAIRDRMNRASKQQKIYLEGKVNAFEYLSKLEKEGKINANIALLLKRKINDEYSGYDGSESETLSDTTVATDAGYNPYKLNDKYFSVFRINFENKGTEVEKINLKEFQLLSNDEQLYPLTSDYFQGILRNNTETIKNALRKNMPDELVLTGGQKVTKYLAVPAINAENEKLQVQFIRDKAVVNFDFTVARKEVNKTYSFNDYNLAYSGEGNEFAYKTFYLVSYKDNVAYALKDTKVFVSNDKQNLPVSIYAIGINTNNADIVFAAEENFKFITGGDNKKKIQFRKIKK